MRVTFSKHIERRVSTWAARRGKRTRVPGATMALGRGDLPHDLVQLIVEAALGIHHGFWGCVAEGATFRSLKRKRTVAGRQVIAAHRAELDAAERLVAAHVARAAAGGETPISAPLERIRGLWADLGDGGSLTVAWPSLEVIASDPGRPVASRLPRPG